jgi:hypothetical protein
VPFLAAQTGHMLAPMTFFSPLVLSLRRKVLGKQCEKSAERSGAFCESHKSQYRMWNKRKKGSRYQPCLAPQLGRVHVYGGMKLRDVGNSHQGGLRYEAGCFFDGCKPRISLCGARAMECLLLEEKLCGIARKQVSNRRQFDRIA